MAEIPQGSAAYRKLNPHLFVQSDCTKVPLTIMASAGNILPQGQVVMPKPAKRIRQSSKPLMNKLEAEFYERILKPIYGPKFIHIQAVTLRLANGVRYTCDFFNLELREAHEVKGEWCVDDSIVKLKMVAALYPEIIFSLNWKKGGEWKSQIVIP